MISTIFENSYFDTILISGYLCAYESFITNREISIYQYLYKNVDLRSERQQAVIKYPQNERCYANKIRIESEMKDININYKNMHDKEN